MTPPTTPPPAALGETIVRTVARVLPRVELIYLFGSHATGEATPRSDVDVAVLPAAPLDAAARWDLRDALEEALSTDVDVVDLRAASTVMRWQVVTGGVLLFERDAARRHRFEIYAQTAYFDLNIERAAIIEDAVRRGTIYG